MPAEFVDITIQEVDEAESYARSGGFLERVFRLSSDPSAEWTAIFLESWDEVECFPKRHARIENYRLVFVCLEPELTGYPMASLVDAVARTNAEYRRRLSGRAQI